MDWDAEGLLEGLEDDDARGRPASSCSTTSTTRAATVDELKQAVAEDRLVLLPGGAPAGRRQDLQPAPDRRRGRARARPPAASIARRSGSPCPTPTPRCSATPTSRARRTPPRSPQAGFSTEDTLEVTRVLGRGMVALRRVAARAVRPDVPRAGRHRARARAPAPEPAEELLPLVEPPARPRVPPAPAAAAAQRRPRDRRAHVGQGLRHAPRPRSRSPTSSASRSWGRPSTSRSSAGSPAGCRRWRARSSSSPCAWSSRSATR